MADLTKDPNFRKLLEGMTPQLPNGGNMGVPADLGLGVTSTLSVPNMEAPAAETPAPFTPSGGAGFVPAMNVPIPAQREKGIQETLSDVFTASLPTMDRASGVTPDAPATTTADPFGVTEAEIIAAGNENFGRADQPVPSGSLGTLPFSPDAMTPAPAPQAPTSGGTITGPDGVVTTFEPQAPTQASTDAVAARQASMDANAAANAEAGLPIGYGPTTRANVAAERPANVSAGTVQVAQREAMQREAEMAADRAAKAFEDQLGYAGRPIAETDKMVAAYRANVLNEAMGKIDPNATGGAGGLTFDQQLSLSKEQRAGREEVRGVQAAAQEANEAQQAEFDQSITNVRATEDAFNKLEPVAREIATLSGTPFTEGGLGWAASKLPLSTDARQIERLSKELEGTTFLQGLIEAKAKGATFGALSEREGDRILAARGKLIAPESTNEQRIAAVNEMMKTIQTSMERARGDHEAKFGKTETKSQSPTGITYSDNSNYEII